MRLFLIGYRCTGKTTIGEILARHLKYEFIDTDRLIEHQTGSSILTIVETQGWEKFRQLEKETLLKTNHCFNTVIATGGGIIMDQENRKFIKKNGISIWLEATIDTILFRLNTDSKTSDSRPSLIKDKNLIKETNEIVKLRTPLYEKTAHIKIDVNSRPPEKIVKLIDRRLKNVRQ